MRKAIILALLLLPAISYGAEMDVMIRDAQYSGWHANVQKTGSKYGVVSANFDAYMISDLDETAYVGEKYYGFIAADGQWYIMQVTGTGDTTYRYVHGTTTATYSTKWGTRHSNSYALWSTEMG